MLNLIFFIISLLLGLKFGMNVHDKFQLTNLISVPIGLAVAMFVLTTLITIARIIRVRWEKLYIILECAVYLNVYSVIFMVIGLEKLWVYLLGAIVVTGINCFVDKVVRFNNSVSINGEEIACLAERDEKLRELGHPDGSIIKKPSFAPGIIAGLLITETLFVCVNIGLASFDMPKGLNHIIGIIGAVLTILLTVIWKRAENKGAEECISFKWRALREEIKRFEATKENMEPGEATILGRKLAGLAEALQRNPYKINFEQTVIGATQGISNIHQTHTPQIEEATHLNESYYGQGNMEYFTNCSSKDECEKRYQGLVLLHTNDEEGLAEIRKQYEKFMEEN